MEAVEAAALWNGLVERVEAAIDVWSGESSPGVRARSLKEMIVSTLEVQDCRENDEEF